MSQNKYMHPRNIYKNPPNFKKLAITYPEFRNFAKQDITGKVTIDFKDQKALRALTTTLLQKDFGLKVEIPLNRLIPTLPLRLNYLLWIEDLLKQAVPFKEDPITGVDIGTGASCIYPLLAARTNGWKMLATEVDVESINYARKNTDCNGLQDLITVKQVQRGTVFKNVLDTDQTYDFTMCNPPFFSNEREVDSSSKSRSPSRPLPHNVKTGSLSEMVVQGGEVAFIQQMIRESSELRNVVKVYSTMVGQKSSLKSLISELEKVEPVCIVQTEFCQGHTTRWGLAWTFIPELNLEAEQSKRKKEKPPMKYVVPKPADSLHYTIDAVKTKIKEMFTQLQIEYKELKSNKYLSTMEIAAQRNTWTHQRRKRREHKKNQERELPQNYEVNEMPTQKDKVQLANIASCLESSNISATDWTEAKSLKRKGDEIVAQCENNNNNNNKRQKVKSESGSQSKYDTIDCNLVDNKTVCNLKVDSKMFSESGSSSNKETQCHEKLTESIDKRSAVIENNSDISDKKEESKSISDISDKKTKSKSNISQRLQLKCNDDTTGIPESYILKALVSIRKVNDEIHVEMAWLEGTAGRDAMHQVLQYIKNSLKLE